jgi:lysophospholipase L1-like esterase
VGAPNASPDCGRSPQGYPTLWAKAHGITQFTDVGCGGRTGDVLAEQVSALSPETDVVTIATGGNDIGWGEQMLTCLISGDQACSQILGASVPLHLDAGGYGYGCFAVLNAVTG